MEQQATWNLFKNHPCKNLSEDKNPAVDLGAPGFQTVSHQQVGAPNSEAVGFQSAKSHFDFQGS